MIEPAGAAELRGLYAALAQRYDSTGWWPARTRFEMMAGAILTQRTRWERAAAAARRLRRAGLLSPARLQQTSMTGLAALLRPCGDHRTRARRLLALARFVTEHGGLNSLARWSTAALRDALLEVAGIGPETADAILLYAFRRPVFVADAYALRLFGRSGWLGRVRLPSRYAPVHRAVNRIFGDDHRALAALHAVLVEHGKALCRSRPGCADCFLADRCRTGRRFNRRPAPGR
ncbi:MAG: endonuclease [Gammaproteobacteria bacterium]|nr:endonuclease [Gammaproteobacteria bacterium]